jgi:hypothetical protein
VFSRDGFELIPAVFDETSLDQLRRSVASVCGKYRCDEDAVVASGVSLAAYTRAHPERNPGVDPSSLESEPYILGNLAAQDVGIWEFLAQRDLWVLAAQLLTAELDEVVYHSAQVLRKPARIGPALSWHRDYGNTYISTDGPFFVRLLVPLQAMRQENGGTGVVPGSHLISDAEALARSDFAESRDGAEFPMVRAGDVLALHSKVIHGGGTNRSEEDRDLLAVQFGRKAASILHAYEQEHLTMADREAFLAGQVQPSP